MIQRQADKVAICIMTIIIVLAGCAASGDRKAVGFTTEDITDNNISEVSSIMENAGLSNIDVFKKWVGESSLLFLLIMMNCIVRDVRYYRNAVKYGMDDLKDINELADKYPESRAYINRKQKHKN